MNKEDCSKETTATFATLAKKFVAMSVSMLSMLDDMDSTQETPMDWSDRVKELLQLRLQIVIHQNLLSLEEIKRLHIIAENMDAAIGLKEDLSRQARRQRFEAELKLE